MWYPSHLLVKTFIIVVSATWGSCWQYFTPLSDITLENSALETRHLHSEYQFGHCQKRVKAFYDHVYIDHMDVLGKKIMRGWIKVMRIPTCIVLRARSFDVDMIQTTTYNFQMCVPRITYCHSHKRYKFFYYEWYIPKDMRGGMNWEIYFFGPPAIQWQ